MRCTGRDVHATIHHRCARKYNEHLYIIVIYTVLILWTQWYTMQLLYRTDLCSTFARTAVHHSRP